MHAAGPLPAWYTPATLGSLGRLVSSGGGSGGSCTRTIAIVGLEASSSSAANGHLGAREGSSIATEGSMLNGGANGRGTASHISVPALRAGVVLTPRNDRFYIFNSTYHLPVRVKHNKKLHLFFSVPHLAQ